MTAIWLLYFCRKVFEPRDYLIVMTPIYIKILVVFYDPVNLVQAYRRIIFQPNDGLKSGPRFAMALISTG